MSKRQREKKNQEKKSCALRWLPLALHLRHPVAPPLLKCFTCILYTNTLCWCAFVCACVDVCECAPARAEFRHLLHFRVKKVATPKEAMQPSSNLQKRENPSLQTTVFRRGGGEVAVGDWKVIGRIFLQPLQHMQRYFVNDLIVTCFKWLFFKVAKGQIASVSSLTY